MTDRLKGRSPVCLARTCMRRSMTEVAAPTAASAQSNQRKRNVPRVIRVETKMLTPIATENNELNKNAAGAGG